MAATGMPLHLRAKNRLVSNPRFSLLFSSSNYNEEPQDDHTSSHSQSQSQPNSSSPPTSSSSYFSDFQAKLRQWSEQQPRRKQPYPEPKVASLEEIRKNLSEFQRRATPGPDPISFQELYQRSVIWRGEESTGRLSFNSIRESLKKINKNRNAYKGTPALSLSKFKESLKLKPADPDARAPSTIFSGTNIPPSMFGKEMMGQKMAESPSMMTEFMKTYTYDQLGEKLKKLRPDTKAENWFSLTKLNERLVKLREMEQKESESMVCGFVYKDLRKSIKKIPDGEKMKTLSVQRLYIAGHLNETPSYLRYPPKEQLVGKYFHPDHMSSSEKMKLELEKVREEFKMSESDCGSSRVQVAQLTTKIKHLLNVLHKKDKHSRKGLIEMVERRKKLLKYLRRTKWNSYCLVLSKLGLRDKSTDKRLIRH